MNYHELPKWKLGAYEYPSYRGYLKILFDNYNRLGYSVLDAGCGKGGFLLNVEKNACGVGLDIKRENIEEAKKVKGLKTFFVVGDLQYLPFKNGTFHIILCRDVLEHIKNAEKVIDQFILVLKKRGLILISTTNLLNPAMLSDTLLPSNVSAKIIKKLGGPDYYERNFRFSPWSIIKKFRQNNFDVKLAMFGIPTVGNPRTRSLYSSSNVKLPLIYYFWIVLNKLTNFAQLRAFKEVMVTIAWK